LHSIGSQWQPACAHGTIGSGAIELTATKVIDSLEFALAGQELRGTVGVAQLARLADSLFDSAGELRFRVRGGRDGRQRPRLELSVTGEINLTCQRCLGRLPFLVEVGTELLVLTPDTAGASVGIEDLDGVPADAHTDVLGLVEDEVLLAIPYAARHAEGLCSTAVGSVDEGAGSPFSVLAKLKQN
jgi:uncharacterized protein